jgi:hypothetical protein
MIVVYSGMTSTIYFGLPFPVKQIVQVVVSSLFLKLSGVEFFPVGITEWLFC